MLSLATIASDVSRALRGRLLPITAALALIDPFAATVAAADDGAAEPAPAAADAGGDSTALVSTAPGADAAGAGPEMATVAAPTYPGPTAAMTPPNDTATPDEEPKWRRGLLGGLRIAVGGRTGYGMPLGEMLTDSDLSDSVGFAVPLLFDAALRLKNGTEVGLYGGIVFGGAGDRLDQNCSDCSVFGYHVGVQLNQHLNSTGFLDPYIGVGLGIDSLTISQSRTVDAITTAGTATKVDITSSTDLRALPELMVQAGLDIGGDPLSFGPFVSFSAAQFSESESEVKCSDFRCPESTLASQELDIAESRQAWHAWLVFGVRGTYLL